MIKFLNNQKGFTLVELVVGMAIMTIIMAGVFGILSVSIKSYQYSQKRVNENQQARVAINAVIDDLRNATEITYPVKYDDQDRKYITYKTPSSPTTDTTIRMGTDPNVGKLMKGTTAVTSNIVNTISFKRDATDARIINVTITLLSPDNKSSGDYVIDTVVFATNLAK